MAQTALLLFALLHTCSALPNNQYNSFTRCQTSRNISALGVLPGGGWDNLRNMDMGRVMNISYVQCQTTEDGFYLIPDEVFVIAVKETNVKASSEIISSWKEHKSVTSSSINAEASFYVLLNGKFSKENQKMKTTQVKYSAQTARVQVRNFLYTVKANPDFTLDSRFAQQVKDIADAIENNQTKNAAYLSEKMVVDYGTHVITTVDAGASLVEEDYLNSKYISDNVSQGVSVKAQAGFNFFNLLKFEDIGLNIGMKNIDQSSSHETYSSNIKYKDIQSHGGVAFYPGITLQKWQESTKNNLVAIDRSGVPLHYIINHNRLSDVPPPTVEKVSQSVQKAIQRYYAVNTRPGCVDVNSKNYNFQANVDDASCEGPATNLSFGGVYQQCIQLSADAGPLCEKLAQKNPDTGDFSCRSPYVPTLLRSEVRQEEYSLNECQDQQTSCGFLGWSSCNEQVCETHQYTRSARIDSYWCSVDGDAPVDSGYLFGGLFSTEVSNPITKSKDCPPNFVEVNFLSDGMVLCLSHDYESSSRFAVPFGGLFSCQSNNTLANNQHRCPPKFSQHVATVSDNCEIFYCVQSMSFTEGELQPVLLPPFTKPPLVRMGANDTATNMTEGEEKRAGVGKQMKKMDPGYNGLSRGEAIDVAFGTLILVGLVGLVAVILVRRRRRLQQTLSCVRYGEDFEVLAP
ncbi:macrophage-expressed gene 1 protein-like [Eucyclogobius newberryi]|uniref:macrophage-expressed gene 1 protein-like n=1 Tax=Eucyclogobius newberryi TaxID=166745 RepID=UPI003B5C717F